MVDAAADELFIVGNTGSLQKQFDLATFGINSSYPSGIIYLGDEGRFAIIDHSHDAIFFIDLSKPGKLQGSISTHILLNSSVPTGMCMISENGHFAFVDSTADEVYVIDPEGRLKARFDTTGVFSSGNPTGIAYDEDNQRFAIVDIDDLQVYLLDLPALVTPCDRCEGDFDGDSDVDGSDLAVFAADFGRTDCP